MAPLERRDAPPRVAILGWLFLVLGLLGPVFLTGNVALFQMLGVGPDLTLPDAVRRMWFIVAWLLAQAFLGLACLRGWRWGLVGYLVVCGGFLLVFLWGSVRSMRDGHGSYFFTVILLGLPYLISLVVLMSPAARSFFTRRGATRV